MICYLSQVCSNQLSRFVVLGSWRFIDGLKNSSFTRDFQDPGFKSNHQTQNQSGESECQLPSIPQLSSRQHTLCHHL